MQNLNIPSPRGVSSVNKMQNELLRSEDKRTASLAILANKAPLKYFHDTRGLHSANPSSVTVPVHGP